VKRRLFQALATLAGLGLPALALAQTCPNPTPITCNSTANGTTVGGPDQIDDYSCIGYTESGPEAYYLLTVGATRTVTASVDDTGGYTDFAIALLPWSGAACDPDACLDGEDGGNPEQASAELQPGQYVIVVDGYSGDAGDYVLTLECDAPATCLDVDHDGHSPYDAALCPVGDDCDDQDASVHPGALDVCDDGLDQDCDGADRPCPSCGDLGELACDTWVQASTADAAATRLLSSYACLPYPENGPEVGYRFTAPRDGELRVRLRSAEADLALAWVPGVYGCDSAHCEAGADRVLGPGEESLFASVQAGATYWVVVDSWSQTPGAFELIVDCAACNDDDHDGHADLYCGGDDCDDARAEVNPDQPEACDELDNDCDGAVDEGFDLGSDPSHCGVCGLACAANQVCSLGECLAGCAAGLEDCAGACVDTQVHLAHCGGCDRPCGVPHALNVCVQGACQVAGCEPGWADCDLLPEDGCEADLRTDPQHCSSCERSCDAYPQGVPECRNGQCLLSGCLAGFGNCNQAQVDGCEIDLGSEPSHCGSCPNACDASTFCYQGGCTDTCPEGMDVCGGQCIPIGDDPRNCGGCGRVCQFANASEPGCALGSCVLGTCDRGFGDCNADPLDGCEYRLGTLAHCRACGDACAFAHAGARCEPEAAGCAMGNCEAGWADCNLSALDGCEIHIAQDSSHCGACGRACGRLEACQLSSCVVTCPDEDDDGFARAGCGGADCLDADRSSYPGAEERCDLLDNDCDGVTDEGYDGDGDGFKDAARCAPLAGGQEPLDCDDARDDVHPGAPEPCSDGVDQDCSGQDLACGCPDLDLDGHPDRACGGDDCEDLAPAILPGAPEACNRIDDDCDGQTDESNACMLEQGCGCASGGPASPALLALALLGLRLGRLGRRGR